jgi:DNA-binding GntR family transcriptional regulator
MSRHHEPVTSPGFAPSQTLAEAVLQHIARDIVEGRLAPGQRLGEVALSDELGVSRSPVREAIRRLAAEGLVELVPRKGAFVASLTAKEVTDVFAVRIELEALSTRLAATLASESDIAELEAINRRCAMAVEAGESSAFFEHNDALHRAIGDIARNEYLQWMRSAASARTFRPLFMHLSSTLHLRQSTAEHAELIAAIAARTPDDAEQAIRHHLENSMREAAKLVEAAAGRRAPPA